MLFRSIPLQKRKKEHSDATCTSVVPRSKANLKATVAVVAVKETVLLVSVSLFQQNICLVCGDTYDTHAKDIKTQIQKRGTVAYHRMNS